MSTTYPQGQDDEIIETTAAVPPVVPESESQPALTPEPALTQTLTPTPTPEPEIELTQTLTPEPEPAITLTPAPAPEPEPEIIIDEEIGDGRDVPSVKDKQR